MTTRILLPTLLLAFACDDAVVSEPTPDDPGGDQGGQSGSLVPVGCLEVDRITITDPATIPAGAQEAAQDLYDEMTGTFTGTYGSLPLTLDLQVTGDPDLVFLEPDTGGTVPVVVCPPYQWEIPVDVGVQALPDLDELAATTLVARSVDEGWWGFVLDVSEVNGASTPDWDPADFDHTELRISADRYEGAWRGSLSWSSYADTTSATQEGSGMVAPEAPFSASR